LKRGDNDAWDETFRRLYPAAFAAARHPLASLTPAEAEDIAIEALTLLLPKVSQVAEFDELRLLVITIASRKAISEKLMQSRPVPPLPGVDLAPLIKGEWARDIVQEHDGTLREGVLFITDDEITAPLAYENDDFGKRSYAEFAVYNAAVDHVINGKKGHDPVPMTKGPVKQPNHVRCVRTQRYKLARYCDPSKKVPDEWEMYDLKTDAIEAVNLVEVNANPPKARDAAMQGTVDDLAKLLQQLEVRYLS